MIPFILAGIGLAIGAGAYEAQKLYERKRAEKKLVGVIQVSPKSGAEMLRDALTAPKETKQQVEERSAAIGEALDQVVAENPPPTESIPTLPVEVGPEEAAQPDEPVATAAPANVEPAMAQAMRKAKKASTKKRA